MKPVPVHDQKTYDLLLRIERMLTDQQQMIRETLNRSTTMADSLDDIRANVQDLGVDVDSVLTVVQDTKAQLAEALNNAGVDQASRDQINALIDGMQQKISDAINPAVPVDPSVPPSDPTAPEVNPLR